MEEILLCICTVLGGSITKSLTSRNFHRFYKYFEGKIMACEPVEVSKPLLVGTRISFVMNQTFSLVALLKLKTETGSCYNTPHFPLRSYICGKALFIQLFCFISSKHSTCDVSDGAEVSHSFGHKVETHTAVTLGESAERRKGKKGNCIIQRNDEVNYL